MKILSGKQMAKLLEKKGWELKRIHGSHHIYAKEERTERISIPVHRNRALKIGLQKHIMKIAEITEDEL